MCHEFDLRERLRLSERALPRSDLLITKLQIIEINKKDIMDAALLTLDTPLFEGNTTRAEEIEVSRIISYTSDDWGIYKTLTSNIEKMIQLLPELPFTKEEKDTICEKLSRLFSVIESSPKSFAWRMRAKVGERKRWYELPEST